MTGSHLRDADIWKTRDFAGSWQFRGSVVGAIEGREGAMELRRQGRSQIKFGNEG
jgi:hypothetical protein